MLNNFLYKSFNTFPDNYEKVLIYTVDVNKPINSFINRKMFPILRNMKGGEIMFDHLLLGLVGETSTRYRLLVKDRDYKVPRVEQYIRKIKMVNSDEEKEEEVL